MKKMYKKPELALENFALTQSIAVSCEGVSHSGNGLGVHTFYAPSSCGWQLLGTGSSRLEGKTLWNLPNVCDIQLEGADSYEYLCYNQPEGHTAVFAS